jgi:guanylate kinase
MSSGPLLVVLSGPSGAGKDAVLIELKRRGVPCHFTVTATTRTRRAGEREGVDYHFLTESAFLQLIESGGLLEHKLYDGTYRGVPREQVAAALTTGKDVVMRTDVAGARSLKQLAPGAILIFIYPPSLDVLRRRMKQRRSESDESLRERMALAPQELAHIDEFDYAVLNEDGELSRTVDQVQAIMTAEHCRVGRVPVVLG